LWPIAWLWAYTRPIGYKIAYGTEKHEDFFIEHGERARRGELAHEHIDPMLAELDALERAGHMTPALWLAREQLLAARAAVTQAQAGAPASTVAPAAASIQARGA
jgi:hypothetical protein